MVESPITRSKAPRIVFIGGASVGKTSLIARIKEGVFKSNTQPTTGTGFFSYQSPVEGRPLIQIWDTAGMERYRALNSVFYREAVGGVLTFDLTNYTSFQEMDVWLNDFIANATTNLAIVIAANKSDLKDRFEVEKDEIQKFADEHHLTYYMTSAKTGDGVDEMLEGLLSQITWTDECVETKLAEVPQKGCKC
jgi:small GTP-binding protein